MYKIVQNTPLIFEVTILILVHIKYQLALDMRYVIDLFNQNFSTYDRNSAIIYGTNYGTYHVYNYFQIKLMLIFLIHYVLGINVYSKSLIKEHKIQQFHFTDVVKIHFVMHNLFHNTVRQL